MKVTTENEIDLEDFDAWSGGREWLDELIKCGTVKKAQQTIEELFPDGIDAGALNDFLWFDVCENHKEWWNENYDEMQEVKGRIDKDYGSEHVWYESESGPVTVEYEEDPDDLQVFNLDAYVDGHYTSFVEYDFKASLEQNLQVLKDKLKSEDGVLPKLAKGLEYVESFPCWAATYCMYGDESGLSRRDVELADQWMLENGYGDLVSMDEDTHASFDYPAFGAACDTETAVFSVSDKPIFVISYDDDDGNEHYLENETNSFTARRFYSEEDARSHIRDVLGDSDKYTVLKVYDPKPEEKPDEQDARP